MANNRAMLESYGLKEALVAKLNDNQVTEIIAFAMDNIKASNLTQLLIQIASMEISGKHDSAYLASNGIANVLQLKNLSPEQILEIAGDYRYQQDEALARKMVKDKIIENQQDKLSAHMNYPLSNRKVHRNDVSL